MEYGVAIARFLLGMVMLPLAVPDVRLLYLVASMIASAYLLFAIAVIEDAGP